MRHRKSKKRKPRRFAYDLDERHLFVRMNRMHLSLAAGLLYSHTGPLMTINRARLCEEGRIVKFNKTSTGNASNDRLP